MRKKNKYCINSLNECLVQLKNKYQPQLMDLIDNKDSQDKTVISEARNEILKKYMQKPYQYKKLFTYQFII